jgi:hypothetical protein
MTLYITFGQVHSHVVGDRVFDKDTVGVIECKDYADGRRIAADYFGDKFFTTYDECPNMAYLPKGLVPVNPAPVTAMFDRRNHSKCPFCAKDMTIDANRIFRDKLSIKEYNISGLCQLCQDKVFES